MQEKGVPIRITFLITFLRQTSNEKKLKSVKK